MSKPQPLEPKNLTAQLGYAGRGNPPSSHARSAIANCFPGLEFDFRNVWKQVLIGIELHESDNAVVQVEQGGRAATAGIQVGFILLSVAGQMVERQVVGPRVANGPNQVLTMANLEWTNALANILQLAGQTVACRFLPPDRQPPEKTVDLEVRRIFDGILITAEAAEPGALTQGLCSPWQADYRECACYYWAASRPDFVNVEVTNNVAAGHNWTQKGRTPATPKIYRPDASGVEGQLTYEDLYRNWERELRFIFEGKDESSASILPAPSSTKTLTAPSWGFTSGSNPSCTACSSATRPVTTRSTGRRPETTSLDQRRP